jgi:accessory gene regulator protein AgrB
MTSNINTPSNAKAFCLKICKCHKTRVILAMTFIQHIYIYIYIKKSTEIRMLVHIKKISKKKARRISHNIIVLTFSLLLQIFRYNV